MGMIFQEWLKLKGLSLSPKSVDAVLKLKEEAATVPFIARYRKEATGNLDEVQIQALFDLSESFAELLKRKAFVLKEIAEQEKLTPELKLKIENCWQENILEDLYLPFKKKKKTKATLAKEAGLEPLFDALQTWAQSGKTPAAFSNWKAFLNPTSKRIYLLLQTSKAFPKA